MRLTVNGKPVDVAAEPDDSLLWVIREKLNLTGTTCGCGMAMAALTGVRLRRLPMLPERVLAALRERA